jgi:hypothetical protein
MVRRIRPLAWILPFAFLLSGFPSAQSQETPDCDCEHAACTSFAAGPKATVDGAAMSGHTCDGNCDFTITVVPGGKHKPEERVRIDYPGLPGGGRHTVYGETAIPQVAETYSFFMTECPIGNEHQVFFGENTCGTRKELANLPGGKAMLDYTQVAALALQREIGRAHV